MDTPVLPTYDPNNVLARILRDELPCECVLETQSSRVIMDIMPRSPGHCLVVARAAVVNVLDCDPEQFAQIAKDAARVSRAVVSAMAATGVTLQVNNGADGGQEIFHLHLHVMPHFRGKALAPPGQAGDLKEIAAIAEKIRRAIASTG